MTVRAHIDIKENELLKINAGLLDILLQDKTTGRNLIWATDNYAKHGEQYSADRQISAELITGKNENVIKPRTEKSKAEQQRRVRQKAEVFTPAWICNMQNNLIDEAWFGRANVFTTREKIHFPAESGKTWRDYVMHKKYIQKNIFINSDKVLVPESNGNGAFEVFNSPEISKPQEAFSDTFLAK